MPIHWVIGLSVGVPVPPHLPHLYCLENKTRGGVTTLCVGGANGGGGEMGKLWVQFDAPTIGIQPGYDAFLVLGGATTWSMLVTNMLTSIVRTWNECVSARQCPASCWRVCRATL